MSPSSKSPDIPVLIVGAGPTGLTAALELPRLGVPVRVVDRAAHPSPESRALAVQARTLELLRVRGVGDEIRRWATGLPPPRCTPRAAGLLPSN